MGEISIQMESDDAEEFLRENPEWERTDVRDEKQFGPGGVPLKSAQKLIREQRSPNYYDDENFYC